MVSPPAGTFQTILIIDLGSQYTQLIARRVRELNVYSEIVSNTLTAAELKARPGVIGLILSGGPNSVYQFGSPGIDEKLLDCGVPVLGICYGLQLMGKLGGGRIEQARAPGVRQDRAVGGQPGAEPAVPRASTPT